MRLTLHSNGHTIFRLSYELRYLASAVIALLTLITVSVFAQAGPSSAAGVVDWNAIPPHRPLGSCSVPTFAPPLHFGAGTSPRGITSGDFNRDGNPDMTVANLDSNNLSVLLGDGTGSFGPATNFAVGASPRSVAVGDLNRDNNPDLAVANFDSSDVSVLLGDGTGSFGPATGFAAGAGPYSVAVGDFNEDSNPDLVVANSNSNNVSMLLGDGAGSFGPATNFGVGASPRSVVVTDLNRDDNIDLSTANFDSNNVSVLLGNGAGGFSPATNFSVATNPISLAIGDFNGDNNPDIATANYVSDNVSVLLGDGAGGFGTATNFGVGTAPRSVAIGDFNRDGIADLAVANGLSNNVSVLLGTGTGTFGAPTNFLVDLAPFSVSVDDFNRDNSPDLATANFAANNMSVLLNRCVPPTPTVAATNTPLPPTSTLPVPTSTAPPIPTSCPLQFVDIDQNHTFYASIRCLVCRGIVSGYSDGTFRPNNPVTRGQLAKIVSNSAGFSEPPTQQTFEDVPSTHTFYLWIERLTIRGYMTGYNCGSSGEPCITGKPYFRPFANATRGQTAKIVSNAARFTEPPIGQTFEDVPPSHTFYEFIQRLATRNVMSGYPCGGPGEPCITGNPYFRPGNDVTRGQSSKIVANAFFPACQTP